MERISLEVAIALLINHQKVVIERETVSLMESLGRVLAEDIMAKQHQPPFDRSPLDGYAVRGEDTVDASFHKPVYLKVIDEVCAGQVSNLTITSGQAIRIMTGGPMPKGSNGVIKQENTDEGMNQVAIYKGISPYQNYCYAGEDYKAGDILLQAGQRIGAYHIGLLASNGMTAVKVEKKIRVGIMSTGDELVQLGQPLKAGKIYNSNLYTLKARLLELGCIPLVMGTVADDVEVGKALIDQYVNQVDIIITTGGVSVGKMDIMHPIFEGLGIQRLFWQLKLKPGTPALAGLYQNKLILALSGNPSAAAITFELLFRPMLSKMLACPELNTKKAHSKMGEAFHKASPTRRFIKAYYENNKVYLTKGNQSPGALQAMLGCNCFVDVAAGTESLEKNDTVTIIKI